MCRSSEHLPKSLLWFCRLLLHHLVHLTFPARGFVCFGPRPKIFIWRTPELIKVILAIKVILNFGRFLKHPLFCHELQIFLHHRAGSFSGQEIDCRLLPRPLLSFRTHSSNQFQFVKTPDNFKGTTPDTRVQQCGERVRCKFGQIDKKPTFESRKVI